MARCHSQQFRHHPRTCTTCGQRYSQEETNKTPSMTQVVCPGYVLPKWAALWVFQRRVLPAVRIGCLEICDPPAIRLLVYHCIPYTSMPSVTLHVVEFTFSRGFESYLRSHSFNGLPPHDLLQLGRSGQRHGGGSRNHPWAKNVAYDCSIFWRVTSVRMASNRMGLADGLRV